jgi:hypothetical protein
MIFIASVELEPLPGSKMAGGRAGAMVYCLIPAESKRAAKQRLRAALEEDKYRLIRTELMDDYKHFRWESMEDQAEYDKLAKRAALNNDIVYGPFYTWKTR